MSQENSNSRSSTFGSTMKSAVASASASIAVVAMVHVATTVSIGNPVAPSRTWCSPSPHARRLAAEAHSAPSWSSTTPIAWVGS
ncbi:hypothetical protein AHiyo1_07250 [Arthrobacter sp. Hiyo1]|nr:hypothetical protein AHiyo1_07250 [Arthrobacter sp. Hiyo1]